MNIQFRFQRAIIIIFFLPCFQSAFSQLPDCADFQVVTCDSLYQLESAGFGQLVSMDSFGESYYGQEHFFKFRAANSDELFLTAYDFADGYQRALVTLRDSAVYSCFDSLGGTQYRFNFSVNNVRTISLGQVLAGHTYYVVFDRWADDSWQYSLRFSCPDACPYPRFTNADSIGNDHVRLQWQNNSQTNQWELEIVPIDSVFKNSPTHTGYGNSVTISGLQDLTLYQWRVRNICSGNVTGGWSPIDYVGTAPDCNNLVDLACDEITTFNFVPRSELLTVCGSSNSYRGPEVYARYIPPYDGIFTLRFESNSSPVTLRLMQSQIGQNCTLSPWDCLGTFGFGGPSFKKTGFLKKDSTYLFAFEFDNLSNHEGQYFRIKPNCPPLCITPDSLYKTNITPNSATIGWKAMPNQVQWEVRLIAIRPTSSDTLYFLTDTPSLSLSNLNHGNHYSWQVRGICNGGNSGWSAFSQFINPLDCNQFPIIDCGDSLRLFFSNGYGYLKNGSSCKFSNLQGYDEVLHFDVNQDGESRFLIGLGKKAVFFRKRQAGDDCLTAGNWICISDSMVGQVTFLRNLSAGNYEILVKQSLYYGLDTMDVQLLCALPCSIPTNTLTKIQGTGNGFKYIPLWTDLDGPWIYEIELKDEQGQSFTAPALGMGQSNLNVLFNLVTGKVYSWRVRKKCQNGALVTDWTDWNSFKTVDNCIAAPLLTCGIPISFQGTDQPLIAFDECENKSDWGYAVTYRFKPPYNGDYFLDVSDANGQEVKYIMAQKFGSCDSYTTLSCGSVSSNGMLSLGPLVNTITYNLMVRQEDSLLASQTFTLKCPCLSQSYGEGTLFADSTAHLSFFYSIATLFEIELLPVDVPFSGTGNYWRNLDEPIIGGLDPTLEYHFRFRPTCAPDLAWSDEIDLNHAFDCQALPVLGCDSTAHVFIGAGGGLKSNTFGNNGLQYHGQERFLKFKAENWGLYTFHIEKVDGNASIKAGLFNDCSSGGSLSYTPININAFTSVVLSQGEEFTLVMDNFYLSRGNFLVTVACVVNVDPPHNDEIFSDTTSGNLLADSLLINEPCRTFSNHLATANANDPDPSLLPGNWLDGPQKTVWFYFDAPESQTVQVRVNSTFMDPQVALLRLEPIDTLGHPLLATGENQPGSENAMLLYTGLIPETRYLLMVDGVGGSEGDFCIEILDEPILSNVTGICQTYPQPIQTNVSPNDWINFYANDGPINGPLLAAIQTSENLGLITVSTEIHPDAPLLANGQKILPRYFNIDTEFQPDSPVKLRLFFTEDDLAVYNLTPPVDTLTISNLGITHYDGDSEDCDPENNSLGAGNIPVMNSTYQLVGENGIFYLETTITQFSEFGASIYQTSKSTDADLLEMARVFPVPTSGPLSVELWSNEAKTLQLEIAHITGLPLLKNQLEINTGRNIYNLDVAMLPAGTYLLKLRPKTGTPRSWVFIKL